MLASPGPIAFFLGPLRVRWYGILVAAAIGLGFWLADRRARAEGLRADRLLSTAQWAVIAGFVGARLYEVAFNWEYYGRHLDKIPAVWEGGLAIHGALIAGSLVGVTLAMYWRLPVLRSLDVAAPSIALGQAIGRWGNFFNEEALGYPTALPWKLYVSPDHRPPGYEAGQLLAGRHPSRTARERGCAGGGRCRTRVDFPRGRPEERLTRPSWAPRPSLSGSHAGSGRATAGEADPLVQRRAWPRGEGRAFVGPRGGGAR